MEQESGGSRNRFLIREKHLLIFVLILAVLARAKELWWHDLWQVEAMNAWLGQLPPASLLEALKEEGTRPPLYFLLLKVWSLPSVHEAWLRLLSLVLSTGGVYLAYAVARRLFCWRTGIVSAGLCATSPLLATSAGAVTAPYALDFFLAGLILLSFIRLVKSGSGRDLIFHGLALAAGAYGNAFLLAMIPMEALFLLVHFKGYLTLWPKWASSALLSLILFLPWTPAAAGQMQQRYGHDDLVTDRLGLRMSCLFTELCLGRLYAWEPLTPVISLFPSDDAGEDSTMPGAIEERDEGTMVGVLEAMQMIYLGCFTMLALIGFFAPLKLSPWPLPPEMQAKRNVLRALRRAKETGHYAEAGDLSIRNMGQVPPKQSAVLLLFCFLSPMGLGEVAHVFWGWKFEGSELLFIALPLLILLARGIGALEWRVMFYGVLGLIMASSLFFTLNSRGLDGLSNGSKEGAEYLERNIDWDEKTAVVHESALSYFPFRFYTASRLEETSFIAGDSVRRVWGIDYLKKNTLIGNDGGALEEFDHIWWVRIAPPPGTVYSGALEYLNARTKEGAEREAALIRRPREAWVEKEVVSFENLTMTLYIRGT